MSAPTLARFALVVGGLTLLAGCGDSTGPKGSISIITGSGQTGPGGEDLPESLRVVVKSASGAALAGATVSWSVTAGGASVSPSSSTTDANGETAALLSLGPIGSVTVTATGSGVTTATFTATATNPCANIHAFGLGQTVTGNLRQYDCALNDGSFIDFYHFSLSGQQALYVQLVAPSFDAYIWFLDGSAVLLGVNDDSLFPSVTNSFFKVVAAPGDYVVGANSYNPGEIGPYTMSAATTNQSEENCEEVWLTRGVTTTQTLSTTDCATAGPTYADAFWLHLDNGANLDVTATTLAFDAVLQLDSLNDGGSSLLFVASDDSVGGTHLTYTAPSSNYYLLVATTMTPGGLGAYTLTLPAPPVSATIRAPKVLASPLLLSKRSRGSAKR